MAFRPVHPTLTNAMMDTCVMDTSEVSEIEAAREVIRLADENPGNIMVPYSVRREMKHPNAPVEKQARSDVGSYTIQVGQTPGEHEKYVQILAVLTGDGKPEKYANDARHVMEAAKYGSYLITTDARIVKKRDELRRVCQITIVKPTEYVALWNSER